MQRGKRAWWKKWQGKGRGQTGGHFYCITFCIFLIFLIQFTCHQNKKKAVESDSCFSMWHIRKSRCKVMMRWHINQQSHNQSHIYTALSCLLFIPSAFWWMANMPAVYSFVQLAFRCSEFSHSIQHHLPFAKAFPLTSLRVPDCRWWDLPVCVSPKKTSSRFLQPSNTLFLGREVQLDRHVPYGASKRQLQCLLTCTVFEVRSAVTHSVCPSVGPRALWVMCRVIYSHWF